MFSFPFYSNYYDSDSSDDYGYGFGYNHRGWGPDRRGWAEKSDAALEREEIANGMFDRFLKKCSKLPVDSPKFPLTEEIVKANNHLTSACWRSFRQRVESKGCKAKRREATAEERRAAKDHRKGKVYVVSCTCPVHPSKADEYMAKAKEEAAARKEKAKLAKQRKAEREQFERMERERQAALHRAKVREAYANIASVENKQHLKTPIKKDEAANARGSANTSTKTSPTSVTMDPDEVKVTADDLLKHAQTVHEKNISDIHRKVNEERCKLMDELQKKHDEAVSEMRDYIDNKRLEQVKEARKDHDEIEQKIKDAY